MQITATKLVRKCCEYGRNNSSNLRFGSLWWSDDLDVLWCVSVFFFVFCKQYGWMDHDGSDPLGGLLHLVAQPRQHRGWRIASQLPGQDWRILASSLPATGMAFLHGKYLAIETSYKWSHPKVIYTVIILHILFLLSHAITQFYTNGCCEEHRPASFACSKSLAASRGMWIHCQHGWEELLCLIGTIEKLIELAWWMWTL